MKVYLDVVNIRLDHFQLRGRKNRLLVGDGSATERCQIGTGRMSRPSTCPQHINGRVSNKNSKFSIKEQLLEEACVFL
jgi:hypothetical protein